MLEEMGLYEPFDRALFLSGCSKHKMNNSDFDGYIVSDANLERFANIMIEEYEKGNLKEWK